MATGLDLRSARPGRGLTTRRLLVLVAPVVLIASTYPSFQVSRSVFGEAVGGQLAWFAGMAFYWAVWGGLFSLWALGPRRSLELVRPRSPTPALVGHLAFIVAMAAAVRFLVPGMGYEKAAVGAVILLLISTLANGLFEELFWRGVYLEVFRNRLWLRVVWPSVWFGLWHRVPGSISADGPQVAMVIGPLFLGLYLSFLAKKTDSVWWPLLAHAFGGLVLIA